MRRDWLERVGETPQGRRQGGAQRSRVQMLQSIKEEISLTRLEQERLSQSAFCLDRAQ